MENFRKPESRDSGRSVRRFDQIVGNSPALEAVLAQVERVAVTDSTVLILGETGTGKELIARAIHNLSPRCGRPLVKVNCAAIPFDLLESELFGHERGAFTGAVAQRLGRFELADTGTLFLDEVGDIPLALQPKLLRVLQEQEFERLGGARTRRVNVRVVAATHRDIPQMVRQKQFREDLFYRLHVFPVRLPALRERREDIEPLVTHYVEFFAERMGKRIDSIAAETLESFKSYAWPGNVRELQNLIERAVILSSDGVLTNPLPPEAKDAAKTATAASLGGAARSASVRPMQAEKSASIDPGTTPSPPRKHSLGVLKETNGEAHARSHSPNGAAQPVVSRAGLLEKMNKLGLSPSAQLPLPS